MMKATAILSSGTCIKGIFVRPSGIDVSGEIPLIDSHNLNLRNPCLGHCGKGWVETFDDGDAVLMGSLIFDDSRAGRRAFGMVERGELTGCSCRFGIQRISIHDGDGNILDVDEALERRHDPDIFFVAERSVLEEVSITAMPSDPGAVIVACSPEAVAWSVIRDGEARLRRLLRPENEYRDDGLRLIRMPPAIQFDPWCGR
jgi:hypothetical protein